MSHSQTKQVNGHVFNPGKNDVSQADPTKVALKAAKVAVYREKKPTIYFICLGNEGLPTKECIHSFYTVGDLSKHFKRKHIGYTKEGDRPPCKALPSGTGQ